MSSSSEAFIQILLIFLLLPSSICQLPLDTLTPNQPIRDGDVLVSSRKLFALGFFSPGNPQHRYVGVWFYKVPEKTIVWVANRNHPVNDSSGVLSISGDGGLVIHGKDQSTPLWSANVTLSSPNKFTAKLRDTGNLVLLENGNQRVVWDSFDYPSDTVLSSMKLGLNRRSGLEWLLTSWKSKDDPGTGSCTYGIDPRGSPQLFLKKRGGPLWRSGPWIGDRWSGEPQLTTTVGLFNLSFVNNEDEISYKRVVANDSLFTRGVLDESGIYQRLMWNDKENKWIELVSDPNEWCDNYGLCGPNSNCDPYSDYKFACTCLPGFEPKSPSDWYLRIGVGGCIRKAGVSVCRNGEGFVPVNRVKVPDSSTAVHVNMSLSLEACKLECLMDCSCTAYTSADERGGGNGCLTWHGDLMDTRTYPKVGQDLYVRVDATSLAQHAKSNGSLSKKATLAISLGSVTVFLLLLTLHGLVSMKMKGNRRRNQCSFILTAGSTYFEESSGGTAFDDSRINSELAFFHLKTITTATNNFSIENKLGEGGFGSVYKGILHNGKEIAVKTKKTIQVFWPRS